MPKKTGVAAAILLALCLTALLLPSGAASASETVLVSGKTVYLGMGVEEARIVADDGKKRLTGKSGYHGSFLLHLEPGTYDLAATLTLPGEGDLTGEVEDLEIKAGVGRLDKIVIELKKAEPK